MRFTRLKSPLAFFPMNSFASTPKQPNYCPVKRDATSRTLAALRTVEWPRCALLLAISQALEENAHDTMVAAESRCRLTGCVFVRQPASSFFGGVQKHARCPQ